MTYPQWLQETIATEIDENGEVSDCTKETIANLVDDQPLANLFSSFDEFIADREYLQV